MHYFKQIISILILCSTFAFASWDVRHDDLPYPGNPGCEDNQKCIADRRAAISSREHDRVMGTISLISSPESLEAAIATFEGVDPRPKGNPHFKIGLLRETFKAKFLGLILSGILAPEPGTYLSRLGLAEDVSLLSKLREKQAQLEEAKAVALAKEAALRAEALRLVEPVMAEMRAALSGMSAELAAMKLQIAELERERVASRAETDRLKAERDAARVKAATFEAAAADAAKARSATPSRPRPGSAAGGAGARPSPAART